MEQDDKKQEKESKIQYHISFDSELYEATKKCAEVYRVQVAGIIKLALVKFLRDEGFLKD